MRTFEHNGQVQTLTREAVSLSMYGNTWTAADVAKWDAEEICSGLIEAGFFDFADDGDPWAGPVTDEMRQCLLEYVTDGIESAKDERIAELEAKMADYIGETESRDEYQDAMRGWLTTPEGAELRELLGQDPAQWYPYEA